MLLGLTLFGMLPGERLSIELPIFITQGRENPFGLVADSGNNRPAMRDAESFKVTVEVLVVAESLVPLADNHADQRFRASSD